MGSMDVKVGPHWYRNSNGTVEIEGLPQIELELRKTGGVPVRMNFAIFDKWGKLHAKIEANSLVINEQGAYHLERLEKGLVLTTTSNRKRVLTINVGENDQVEIPEGNHSANTSGCMSDSLPSSTFSLQPKYRTSYPFHFSLLLISDRLLEKISSSQQPYPVSTIAFIFHHRL